MHKVLLLIGLIMSFHSMADDMKILSWNAFMLPKPIKFTYQAERTNLIIQAMAKSDYDMIFFQEAFPQSFRNKVTRALSETFPHHEYLGRRFGSPTVFGSGLFVLSKYPITQTNWVYYNSCAVADCFASKGTLLLTVKLPSGKQIQMGSTHLQAGGNSKRVRIRRKQIQQMKKLLSERSLPEIPVVMLGDFNIDLHSEPFQELLRELDLKNSKLEGELDHSNGFPVECYSKPGSDDKELIDHILSGNKSHLVVSGKKIRPFSGMINGKDCPLSDHYGIEAVLTF